ncbi:hypothetical protein IX289_000568 [Fusobacterium sp. DD1]|uniref:MerR family transcriptional regulator n=1 Tax=unclassified Fusobacterium TaxID=2648384 RepID=UPI001B8B78AE|nr:MULTISPECIES: MerR family transcriptional regulator [unclassified Fusobacterium]MBR8700252.1 hypothetical protein [Fusobacterium sp. DD45]MBR8710493.1 hypothetical protein [Fusobacterium sp. DD28]MBR8751057.1 hypothetical protein [Fusobacterium sp. DD26]MBR8761271.1 hypothetical protein [Fusobacterium sp. DD25]MBR8771294.1 hypothetical protein [Fusobacterium sp. DD40]
MEIKEGVLIRGVELAKILGITDRYVRQLAQEGTFTKKGNKYYFLENVQAYVEYQKLSNNGNGDLKELKLKKETEKLDKDIELKSIKIAELRNELHEAAIVEKVMTGMLLNLKGKLLSIPNKVAPLVVGCENLGDIQSIVMNSIEDALLELSAYSKEMFMNTNLVLEDDEDDGKEKSRSNKTAKSKRRKKDR